MLHKSNIFQNNEVKPLAIKPGKGESTIDFDLAMDKLLEIHKVSSKDSILEFFETADVILSPAIFGSYLHLLDRWGRHFRFPGIPEDSPTPGVPFLQGKGDQRDEGDIQGVRRGGRGRLYKRSLGFQDRVCPAV